MKEKTFNNLMKKTKKELIEIIFRKDDVHIELNEKIASLQQQSTLLDIAKRDLDNLSEKYSKLKDECSVLKSDNSNLIENYNELSEKYSNEFNVLTNEHTSLITKHNHLNKIHNDLIKHIKKYKNKIVILTLVSIIELIVILALIIM